jgi:hypothetical protein
MLLLRNKASLIFYNQLRTRAVGFRPLPFFCAIARLKTKAYPEEKLQLFAAFGSRREKQTSALKTSVLIDDFRSRLRDESRV